jgi:predicted DNA-binding transcriptional regulator AlpA
LGSRRSRDAALDRSAVLADFPPILRAGPTARVANLTQQIEAVMASPESRAELRDLVAMLAAQQIRGLSLLVEQPAQPQTAKLLTVDEASEVLGLDKRWIYRHHRELPFTVHPSPGLLRFDSVGIQQWIASGRKR